MKTKTIIQALYYLATKNNGEMNKITAIKLIYFADRYHLRKYARMITKDVYYAMENGPVPSMTLDIINGVLCPQINDFEEAAAQYIKPLGAHLFGIVANGIDVNCLSKSDIESLDFAYNKFFSQNKWKVVEKTHQYPEWKRYEKIFDEQKGARFPILLEDFFEDSQIENDPYKEISPEVVQLSREDFFDIE